MDWVQNETFESWDPNADDKNQIQQKKHTMSKEKVIKKRRQRYEKFYGEPPAKRSAPSIRLDAGFKWNLQTLANAADAVESGGKSPVSALNELGVKVHYTVLRQGGAAHCPSFTVAVTVADMTFEGWGHSKREARASAARACLAALLARAGRVLPSGNNQNQDFTSDEPPKYPVSDFQCLETKMSTPPPAPPPVENNNGDDKNGTENGNGVPAPRPTTPSTSPSTALFGSQAPPPTNKSPINVLYENYSGLVFTCTFGDGSPLDASQAPLQLSHSMRFKVVCQIKDQKFEGYGSSKKLAKLACARSALAALDETRADAPPLQAPQGFLHQTLADHIGKLVNEKFNELMKNDLVHSKRKVLAGIVITINNKMENARVIAVTTGTKCVSGEHMSVTGRAVNDCHAEVAARRCLQRHLYAQLLMYANQPDPRVPIPDNDLEPIEPSGYQLRADRLIHLYISTAPCGDGRIFSPHELQDSEPDKHPNRLARGQLRTKIESGEGTIPVKNCNNVVQTWDGVMQGERLLTMSCSDKVARWAVAGLQGALLARLLRPVYLHSLVLGSLLHPHHMYRAICGRIESYISSLPPPFKLHRPLLARAASTEARTPARAPSFSVCWCATTPLPEVINATTGKLESGQPSLLCKQSMFGRWQYLVKKLPQIPQETEVGIEPEPLPANLDGLLYNEAKQLSPTYQLAKTRLIEAFEKAKLGRWVKKPLEQDQFVCEIATADPNALFAWAGVYLHAWDSMANVVGRSGQSGGNSGQSGSKCGQNKLRKAQTETNTVRTIESGQSSMNKLKSGEVRNIDMIKNYDKVAPKSDNISDENGLCILRLGDRQVVTNLNPSNNEISSEKLNRISSINNKIKMSKDINSNVINNISSFEDNNNNNKYDSNAVSKSVNNNSIINIGSKINPFNQRLENNTNSKLCLGRGRGRLSLLNNNTYIGNNNIMIEKNNDSGVNFDNFNNNYSSFVAHEVKNTKNINLNDDNIKYWSSFYKKRAQRFVINSDNNEAIIKNSRYHDFDNMHKKFEGCNHNIKEINDCCDKKENFNQTVEKTCIKNFKSKLVDPIAEKNRLLSSARLSLKNCNLSKSDDNSLLKPKNNMINYLNKCREIDKANSRELDEVFNNLKIDGKNTDLDREETAQSSVKNVWLLKKIHYLNK